jgi:excisionase family DNA binding protein
MTIDTRDTEPLLLRPDEAAVLLGISRSKVYSLIQRGRLPSVRLLGSVRVPTAALHALIDGATEWPEAPVPSTRR